MPHSMAVSCWKMHYFWLDMVQSNGGKLYNTFQLLVQQSSSWFSVNQGDTSCGSVISVAFQQASNLLSVCTQSDMRIYQPYLHTLVSIVPLVLLHISIYIIFADQKKKVSSWTSYVGFESDLFREDGRGNLQYKGLRRSSI